MDSDPSEYSLDSEFVEMLEHAAASLSLDLDGLRFRMLSPLVLEALDAKRDVCWMRAFRSLKAKEFRLASCDRCAITVKIFRIN